MSAPSTLTTVWARMVARSRIKRYVIRIERSTGEHARGDDTRHEHEDERDQQRDQVLQQMGEQVATLQAHTRGLALRRAACDSVLGTIIIMLGRSSIVLWSDGVDTSATTGRVELL